MLLNLITDKVHSSKKIAINTCWRMKRRFHHWNFLYRVILSSFTIRGFVVSKTAKQSHRPITGLSPILIHHRSSPANLDIYRTARIRHTSLTLSPSFKLYPKLIRHILNSWGSRVSELSCKLKQSLSPFYQPWQSSKMLAALNIVND